MILNKLPKKTQFLTDFPLVDFTVRRRQVHKISKGWFKVLDILVHSSINLSKILQAEKGNKATCISRATFFFCPGCTVTDSRLVLWSRFSFSLNCSLHNNYYVENNPNFSRIDVADMNVFLNFF